MRRARAWRRPRIVLRGDNALVSRAIVWVLGFVLVTGVFATVYVAAQQSVRASANTESAAVAAREVQLLAAGSGTLSEQRVELTADSGPFVVVYDADNAPVAGTVVRNGALPVVPTGVLAAARLEGQDKVTWQPAAGLRFAVVARAASDGRVVVGGQSLTPFEDRDTQTLILVALGWLASIACMAGAWVLIKIREAPAAASSR
jgi:hypothetical protein